MSCEFHLRYTHNELFSINLIVITTDVNVTETKTLQFSLDIRYIVFLNAKFDIR